MTDDANVFLWFVEVKTYDDLLPPGALPGTVPTDLEQATGLERLELLGKMQGIDVFDMKPLDASRKGRLFVFFLKGGRSWVVSMWGFQGGICSCKEGLGLQGMLLRFAVESIGSERIGVQF